MRGGNGERGANALGGRRAAVRAGATVVLVAGVWLALLAPAAAAHALLIGAVPAVDATVVRSPAQILLTFSV